MVKLLISWIKSVFRGRGYDIVPWHSHLPEMWGNDPTFISLYDDIRDRTLVPAARCFALYEMALALRAKPGAVAEVGIYKGGTARLLAATCPDKPLHLFDTFEGMPETDPSVDGHRTGDFADTSLKAVKTFVDGGARMHFHVGLFPDTAAPIENDRVCLVHVDVDIYQSVRACLKFFYPRLVPGGALVFDDYETERCPGVRKAIDEFLADKPERQIVTARYQCAGLKH